MHTKLRTETIAVLGANGKSGQAFVKAALENGYKVRAGIYRNNTLTDSEYLEVIRCDATNIEDVARLINGCTYVVSLIGHTSSSDAHVQTNSMKTIVEAMANRGISRIVSLTGTGVRQSGDTPSLIDSGMNLAISLIDRPRIEDGISHAEVLKESALEWSIVRVLKLTNANAGQFSLTSSGPAKNFVPRAEVAKAILDILDHHSWVRQMPIISPKSKT